MPLLVPGLLAIGAIALVAKFLRDTNTPGAPGYRRADQAPLPRPVTPAVVGLDVLIRSRRSDS